MENKKREYLAPKVEVKAVEIESSICNGSDVEFGDPNHKIDINQQVIVDTKNNDFSGEIWTNPTTPTE